MPSFQFLRKIDHQIVVKRHHFAHLDRTVAIIHTLAIKQVSEPGIETLRGLVARMQAHADLLGQVTKLLGALQRNLNALEDVRHQVEAKDVKALNMAAMYRDQVLPLMKECRITGDQIERLVDDTLWPMPKYREMLFIY